MSSPARSTRDVVASRPTAVEWLHLGLAGAFGAALRLRGIGRQVLVDDEWHALHEVLQRSYGDFLFDDGWTPAGDHYSVPYALLYEALASGPALSELTMRLPSLVAGIATPVVLALLVRRRVGAGAALAFAYLLAVSPLLVFFSRFARPYAPALLLAFVALVAFWSWLTRGGRVRLAALLACAALAAWLHASTMLLFAGPLAWALVVGAGGARGSWREHIRSLPRSPRRGPLVAGVLALVAAASIVLPYLFSPATLERVLFYDPPTLHTWRLATELWLGTANPVVLLGMLALAAAGMVVAARERDRFVGYLLLTAGAQVGAMLVASPRGMKFGVVLARFCLFVVPLLLLLVALGVDRLVAALRGASPARTALVALTAALMLCASGPLPRIHFLPNAFTNHGSWQADYRPDRYFEQFAPRCVPRLYAALSRLPPGTLRVVEAPWYYYWHSFAYYQRLHRQHVLIGFVDPRADAARIGEVPRDASGIRLRNAVHVGDLPELARREVDLVVLHRDLFAEMRFPFSDVPAPVETWLETYRERFGAPLYEDAHLAAWLVRDDPAKRALIEQALAAPPSASAGELRTPLCDERAAGASSSG